MPETKAQNAAELIDLDFFKDPTTARLLGVITALGGEVYVLKALVQRLTVALESQGVVTDEILQQAGESAPYRDWLATEETAFGSELLRPWLEPDEAVDARRFMAAD